MRLTFVRLLVTDFAACFRFYRDVIGLKPTWGDENSGYADFEGGAGVTLALFDRHEMAKAVGRQDLPAQATAQDRAALIFEVADLQHATEQLRSRGATIAVEPVDRPDWGIRTAHLRDPDGNLIELYVMLPRQDQQQEQREVDETVQR